MRGSLFKHRRKFLKSAGVATAGSWLYRREFSDSARGWGDIQFVAEQGDSCIPIIPLGNDEITDYYREKSTSGTSQWPLKPSEPGTSRLFLHDGPEGLSISFHHGGSTDDGGAVSLLICGLPITGEWVLLDHSHDGTADEFHTGGQEALLNWRWGDKDHGDGALFQGLGKDFCITIKPVFGESATLAASETEGPHAWRLLSGEGEDQERTDLSMDEPVTIRTGSCDQETHNSGCVMSAESVRDPFEVEVTFCCTTVAVAAREYDAVSLNYLDGTDRRFNGPFEGFKGFPTSADHDHNPYNNIVRSVSVFASGEHTRILNPSFGKCKKIVKGDSGEKAGGY